MKVVCLCGNLMFDENSETCRTYSCLIEQDYHNLLKNNPKTISELVDNMPFGEMFWVCNYCERLHFFKKGKIQVFKIEKEIQS